MLVMHGALNEGAISFKFTCLECNISDATLLHLILQTANLTIAISSQWTKSVEEEVWFLPDNIIKMSELKCQDS